MPKTLQDCVNMTKVVNRVLDNFGFDPAEKAIIAMYLEEAAKAEGEEIEELDRMIQIGGKNERVS